ncbi:MAG: dipeptide/oligopeptide/nickel ABC transporter ATP-binding protein [Verrucomicrobiota bacterium]
MTFRIEEGERVGLVGESGSGKSSLARAILGLQPISGGSISINGKTYHGRSQKERIDRARLVQMVFQDPYHSLNPRRSILQSLSEAVAAQANPPPAKDYPSACTSLLERVGLDLSILPRYPHEFSGGQRQRICIARALAVQPRILICDEAVSALDASTQASVVRLLKKISEEEGISLLFITHDLPLIESLCERVVIMHKGNLKEEGQSAEVFSTPKTKETKRLLDSVLRLEVKDDRVDPVPTAKPFSGENA